MKILIIEDEPALRKIMEESLLKVPFRVETAENYPQGSEKITLYEYDCILLDIMLPGGNGLQLLQEIKEQKKKCSVIIISAKNALEDKVNGLELGADDYLTKPFHLAELTARVKSTIRRNHQQGQRLLEWSNITLQIDERTVTVENIDLQLNRKEFDLLYYFLTNPNRLLTKTSIAEYVWGDYTDQANNLDFVYSQIKNLRKKLGDANAQADIQAVYGIGYKIIEP